VSLARVREILAGVLESAMDAIITVDEQQRIVMYNHAAEQVSGRGQLGTVLDTTEMRLSAANKVFL
jgi:PAS domain-containing protein